MYVSVCVEINKSYKITTMENQENLANVIHKKNYTLNVSLQYMSICFLANNVYENRNTMSPYLY